MSFYPNNPTQIVFLIDFDSTVIDDKDKILLCQIKLFTLKVLTHFSFGLKGNVRNTNLNWGYTVYDKLSKHIGPKISNLCELSYREFKKFEIDIENLIDNYKYNNKDICTESDDIDNVSRRNQSMIYTIETMKCYMMTDLHVKVLDACANSVL